MTRSERRLEPARPHDDSEAAPYAPSIPWKWIVLGLMTVGVVATAYLWNERSKAQALRAGIIRLHEDTLGEASARYRDFRADLLQRIERAARSTPTTSVDPALKLAGLRASPGLYLRIPRSAAASPKLAAQAAAAATPDVIAACLGVAPLAARALFDQGAFLLPEWLDETKRTDSVLRLRVIDDELARRVKRDLPSILTLLQARWFLLVLEHGPRDREPVDVFLYDLREEAPVLQARVQSKGDLLSARARFDTTVGAPKLSATDTHRSGAHDCSIASQIRALAGNPAPEVPAAASPATPTL